MERAGLRRASEVAHGQVRLLLPWYAAGVLDGPDLQRVEEHLSWCEACRAEAADWQHLVQAVRTAYPQAKAPREVLDRTWLRVVRGRRGRGLLAAVAAAAAALLLFFGRTAPYVTLTSPPDAGPALQVVFEPWATEAQIRQALAQLPATVRDGPRPSGLYVVRLKPGADPEEAVQRLRAQPIVRFVELAPR